MCINLAVFYLLLVKPVTVLQEELKSTTDRETLEPLDATKPGQINCLKNQHQSK